MWVAYVVNQYSSCAIPNPHHDWTNNYITEQLRGWKKNLRWAFTIFSLIDVLWPFTLLVHHMRSMYFLCDPQWIGKYQEAPRVLSKYFVNKVQDSRERSNDTNITICHKKKAMHLNVSAQQLKKLLFSQRISPILMRVSVTPPRSFVSTARYCSLACWA